MTTITAVGPALDLDGPLPVAPPYSLLSIPGVLVGDGDRWMNGVNFWGYPSDPPLTWEPCSTGTDRLKDDGGEVPVPRFDPFALYESITCSAMSVGDVEEFANRAAVVLEATQSYPIEQALSQGVALSSNPFFGDPNLTILASGAAVHPEIGIAYLEDAIGGTGRAGIIHLTPSVVGNLGFNLFREVGAHLETANGTPVASGGGYIGSDPVSGSSPLSGQSWAFATGQVEVRLSDLQMVGQNARESLDRSVNDLTYRAEKYALASWDTALQAGVLIDWSICCGEQRA